MIYSFTVGEIFHLKYLVVHINITVYMSLMHFSNKSNFLSTCTTQHRGKFCGLAHLSLHHSSWRLTSVLSNLHFSLIIYDNSDRTIRMGGLTRMECPTPVCYGAYSSRHSCLLHLVICHLEELSIHITWAFSLVVEHEFVVTTICTYHCQQITFNNKENNLYFTFRVTYYSNRKIQAVYTVKHAQCWAIF